jgi:hypothetical protein
VRQKDTVLHWMWYCCKVTWASGLVGGLERDSKFCTYLILGVGCGLVGGSQIVRQKDIILRWRWYCAKECGFLGLRGY